MSSFCDYDIEDVCISEEEEEELLSNNGTDRANWSDAQTKLLLVLYSECIKQVGPQKKFKKKEAIWEYIETKFTEKGHTFTVKQVRNLIIQSFTV